MYRHDWETEFRKVLREKLQLTPKQINFCWKLFPKQGFMPGHAIAHLVECDRMCPELGILPSHSVMEDLEMNITDSN
jgi:hypothetical protein